MSTLNVWELKHVPNLRETLTAAINAPVTIKDCEKIAVCVLQIIKATIEVNSEYKEEHPYYGIEAWLDYYWPDGIAYCTQGIQEYGARLYSKESIITVFIAKTQAIFEPKLIAK
jgi:hypothetical protein